MNQGCTTQVRLKPRLYIQEHLDSGLNELVSISHGEYAHGHGLQSESSIEGLKYYNTATYAMEKIYILMGYKKLEPINNHCDVKTIP